MVRRIRAGHRAQILADLLLLRNVREPMRFYLPEELTFALQYYKYDPKYQIDREVKVDMQRTDIVRLSNRPGRCNSFLPTRRRSKSWRDQIRDKRDARS